MGMFGTIDQHPTPLPDQLCLTIARRCPANENCDDSSQNEQADFNFFAGAGAAASFNDGRWR